MTKFFFHFISDFSQTNGENFKKIRKAVSDLGKFSIQSPPSCVTLRF